MGLQTLLCGRRGFRGLLWGTVLVLQAIQEVVQENNGHSNRKELATLVSTCFSQQVRYLFRFISMCLFVQRKFAMNSPGNQVETLNELIICCTVEHKIEE